MAKQITKLQYVRYSKKLQKLNEEMPRLAQQKQDAAALGDFSENAELDAAKKALSEAKTMKSNLEDSLRCEVVEYDNSATITIGSVIKLTSPSLNGESKILMLADSGDPVIEGVLTTESPVGRIILGNLSGQYTVGKDIYKVEKLRDPDMDEFTKMYPEEELLIKTLFDNIK